MALPRPEPLRTESLNIESRSQAQFELKVKNTLSLIMPGRLIRVREIPSGWHVNLDTGEVSYSRTFNGRPLSEDEILYLIMHEAGHAMFTDNYKPPAIIRADEAKPFHTYVNAGEDMRMERVVCANYAGYDRIRRAALAKIIPARLSTLSERYDPSSPKYDRDEALWVRAMCDEYDIYFPYGYAQTNEDWLATKSLWQAARVAPDTQSLVNIMAKVWRLLHPDEPTPEPPPTGEGEGEGGEGEGEGESGEGETGTPGEGGESEGGEGETPEPPEGESGEGEGGEGGESATEPPPSGTPGEGEGESTPEPPEGEGKPEGESGEGAGTEGEGESEGETPEGESESEGEGESGSTSSEGESPSEGESTGEAPSETGKPSEGGTPGEGETGEESGTPGEGTGTGTSTEGESNPEGGELSEGESEPESSEPESESSEVEQLWNETEEEKGERENPQLGSNETAADCIERWVEAMDKPLISNLTRAIQDMLKKTDATLRTKNQYRGRLNARQGYRVKTGRTDVFTQKVAPDSPRYKLFIGVDVSGSMSSAYLNGRQRLTLHIPGIEFGRRVSDKAWIATVNLAESWSRLRLPYMIVGWSTDVKYVLTENSSKLDRAIAFTHRFDGNKTNERTGVEYMLPHIRRAILDGYTPLVFWVTDGHPNYAMDARPLMPELVALCGTEHLYWVNVSADPDVVCIYWPNRVWIENAVGLIDYMRKVVSKTIARATN